MPSTLADATDLNAREFAVVLPFGAVLAGRTLAAGLQARAREAGGWPGWQKWLASAVVAAYAASLGAPRLSRRSPRPTRSWRRSWPRTT